MQTGDQPAVTGDLHIGSFNPDGPWVIDPDKLAWRREIDSLRRLSHAQVPQMIRRRRLVPGLRSAQVLRHLGGAAGKWVLIDRRKNADHTEALSRRLRLAFQALGPTYVKLGQILSSGEGLFPEQVVRQFRLLRDQVAPEPLGDIRKVIEEDLGRPLEAIFSSFEHEPIAAASIAQVHGATLRTGENVVVKVQRPYVSCLVHKDLAVLSWLAPLLIGRIPVAALGNPPALVELFAETIVEELDFRLEAENMLDIARIHRKLGQTSIVIPRPHPTLVSRRVLVMERLNGFGWDQVDAMRSAGIDTARVLTSSFAAFIEGAMLYGVFHGDLHGGNLLVLDDGKVGLLDFGITGRLDESKRLAFLRWIVGLTTNDLRPQVEAMRDLGALPPDVDIGKVIVELGLDKPVMDPTQMEGHEIAAEVQRIVSSLLEYGAKMPKELMLFAKNLMFLDGSLATMAPEIDVLSEIAHFAEDVARKWGDRIASELSTAFPTFKPSARRPTMAGSSPGRHNNDMPADWTDKIDLEGIKSSFGLAPDTKSLTYKEIQERRKIIRKRIRDQRR